MKHFIWYEKYRPQSLVDLILHDSTRSTVEAYIREKSCPHLLLSGPPGSGKTTLAQILIKDIEAICLSLNASSEDRGIETIRGKVKQFASSDGMGKLKVVFLDESDHITQDAQKALRNTMETFSDNCRFILTANYPDKILPAIRSRCQEIRLESFPKDRALRYCRRILALENVHYIVSDIEIVIDRYYPDIRTIVNALQLGTTNGEFCSSRVGTMLTIDPVEIGDLISKGNIYLARCTWYGVTDFTFLYRYLFEEWSVDLTWEKRIQASLIIAEHLYRDAAVLDREINFTACVLSLMLDVLKVTVNWK